MRHDTTNEACEHAKFVRFGGRRRRCVFCGATWRIRAKKRGPKKAKRRTSDLERTFVERLTIAQQARRSSVDANGLAKRHAKALRSLCERPWPHAMPKGPLILVMDAIWFQVGGERHTAYLRGLRAADEDDLHFLRPVLLPGHESQKQWRKVIGGIPRRAGRRILAVVSDSFLGAGIIPGRRGWVFQRCQAHLLLRFETLCGDRKLAVSWREGRQELKRLAYGLMNAPDEAEASEIAGAFARLGNDPRCPRYLRRIVSETLRNLNEYRACYRHPELRLPATTNALENTNGRIRSLFNRSRGCRTPESLLRWITGFLWFHPTVKCRPKLSTKIRR